MKHLKNFENATESLKSFNEDFGLKSTITNLVHSNSSFIKDEYGKTLKVIKEIDAVKLIDEIVAFLNK